LGFSVLIFEELAGFDRLVEFELVELLLLLLLQVLVLDLLAELPLLQILLLLLLTDLCDLAFELGLLLHEFENLLPLLIEFLLQLVLLLPICVQDESLLPLQSLDLSLQPIYDFFTHLGLALPGLEELALLLDVVELYMRSVFLLTLPGLTKVQASQSQRVDLLADLLEGAGSLGRLLSVLLLVAEAFGHTAFHGSVPEENERHLPTGGALAVRPLPQTLAREYLASGSPLSLHRV